MKDFLLGLSLYPVWRWLHQNTCRHTMRMQEQNKYELCLKCGKVFEE